MGTIAEQINYLAETKTAIKDALVAKGVSVADSDTFRSYAEKIGEIQSGGGESGGGSAAVVEKDVNFRDYDGTILYSYTKSQFLALSSLPELPTQKGLICQGWNYSFEDAKNYVSLYGILEVGANYITDDGKTRFYIKIADKGRMEVPIRFNQSVSNGVVIDWGDGSATQTISGTSSTIITHKYEDVGNYCITLNPQDDCIIYLAGSTSVGAMGAITDSNYVYQSMLRRVEYGKNITMLHTYAFCYCQALEAVSIPQNMTNVGAHAFDYCRSLRYLALPKNMTKINTYAFNYCSIQNISIPKSISAIDSYAFSNCTALRKAIMPGVTSIADYAFQTCEALSEVIMPNNISSISASAFYQCKAMTRVVMPQGLTSIKATAFRYCKSLPCVVMPKGVTSIASNAFSNCTSMAFYDFSNHASVPSLTSGAFASMPTDCKIVVPDSLYDSWIAAANWSTYASQIIKASEYNG